MACKVKRIKKDEERRIEERKGYKGGKSLQKKPRIGLKIQSNTMITVTDRLQRGRGGDKK